MAALAATRFDEGKPGSADPVERESSKPSFQALIYPAIPKEMKLSKDTPPAFLACGENDRQDISQGLPELYLVRNAPERWPSYTFTLASGMGSGSGKLRKVRFYLARALPGVAGCAGISEAVVKPTRPVRARSHAAVATLPVH